MADDDETRFRVDFGGIVLELVGERAFVEQMYRQVMEDVEEARRQAQIEAGRVEKPEPIESKKPTVWVHRCGTLMRKIYMASRDDIAASPIGGEFEMTELNNVYVDREAFTDCFEDLEGGHTLWAEFTEDGREKISEATKPSREALDIPPPKST